MFVNALQIDADKSIDCDLCIVGAGAAGISIARALDARKYSICLVESGGIRRFPEYQDLYDGETSEDLSEDYLTKSRIRMFGGSTNVWGGLCRPLDELDFERKLWQPDSVGWPFARSELIPWYVEAADILDIRPYFKEIADQRPPLDENCDLRMLPFQQSEVRFGGKYKRFFSESRNTAVMLHANAREFLLDTHQGLVKSLRVVSGAGKGYSVRAKHYVLAAGGLENPRILLNSNSTLQAGIGNHSDLLGRFFMTHAPSGDFASILFSGSRTKQVLQKMFKPTVSYFALSENEIREKQLLNIGLALYRIRKKEKLEKLKEFGEISAALADKLGRQETTRIFSLIPIAEQSPNRNSRVTLSDELDFTGMRRLRLDFARNHSDLQSTFETVERFAFELGRCDFGRLHFEVFDKSAVNPRVNEHHMGTTRMHPDPRYGVVNENCRVHQIRNLFVAGSSVFPSGGFANPTLTIVAMSLRLAKHLEYKLA